MGTKKMRIKCIFAVLTAVLCLGSTACTPSGQSESADAEVQEEAALEVWTFYDRNVPGYYYMFLWDDIAKEYDVTIDVKNYSSDEMESRLTPALVTGELPDIFFIEGGTYLDDFVEAGACMEVDPYLEKVSLAPDYLEPSSDGRHYVIPCMLNDYGVVYYDKMLLDQMGLDIPKTWDELEAMISSVKAYNEKNGTEYTPISFGEKDGTQGNLLFDIISVCDEVNASDMAQNDNVVISPETWQMTTEKILRLNELGAFPENDMELGDEEAVTDFINHRSVMLVNRSALLSHLTYNMKENFYIGMFPGTYNESGKYRMVKLNRGVPPGLCINSSSQDTNLAADICIAYLKRVNEENLKAGYKSMLTDSEVKAERLLERHLEMNSLIDSAAGTVSAPSASLDQDRKNTLKALLKDLYGGRADREDFEEEVQSIFNNINE